jgi:hypothetical protein
MPPYLRLLCALLQEWSGMYQRVDGRRSKLLDE